MSKFSLKNKIYSLMLSSLSLLIVGGFLYAHSNVYYDIDTGKTMLATSNGITISGSGPLDMSNNVISNIGNAGTDFTAAGGLTLASDLVVNGGDLTTTATTFNLLNTTPTTINIGGVATAVNIGATTGTTTINNANTNITGNLAVNGTTNDIAGTLNLSGNNLTSSGALTITPASGNNLNIALSGAGDLAVNNNQFYIDTSSGNVGIGTPSPAQKLDVSGSARIYDQTATNGVSTLTVRAGEGQATSPLFQWQNNTGTGLGVIDSSGKLGIGTTTPSSMLYIKSSSVATPVLALESADSPTSDYFQIRSNGATAGDILTVDSSGRVGIGTTTPSQALDLIGSLELQDTTTSTTGVIYKGGNRFIHNFHHPTGDTAVPDGENTFVGINAGNFTMGSTATSTNQGSYNTGVGAYSLYANTTGYDNSALGVYALRSNTTGYDNSALGTGVLYSNTTGIENSALGSGAFYSNTTGSYGSALGAFALNSNTTGDYNSAMGAYSLYLNTTGHDNSALGTYSLRSNTTGYENSAVGTASLYANTTGYENTALGYVTLASNTTGHHNTAVGSYTLFANTTGNHNTGMGTDTLNNNTTGSYNTAVGIDALRFNTTGWLNTAMGVSALSSNTTGGDNTAVGYASLYDNTKGNSNSVVGRNALSHNTEGSYNIAMGLEAGRFIADGTTSNATGSYNVFLGSETKALADGDQNEIVLGYNATGIGSNTVVLGNDDITITALKGSVGIGTTEPGYKLDVAGTTAEDGIRTEMGLDLNPVTNDEAGSISLIEADGNLGEGTYYYSTTFYTATGETQDKPTSPNSVTTDSDHKQVQVTLPVSSDHRVIGRRIYRSVVNGVAWHVYLLADIPNNTQTTYTDNTKDTGLGSKNGAYQENTTSKYITLNGNPGMLIGAADTILGKNSGATIYNNTAESKFNVLIGNDIGGVITTGSANTGIGSYSLNFLTSGSSNTSVGDESSYKLTTGSNNTTVGQDAGSYNQTGSYNTYVGFYAGQGVSGNSNSYNSFFGGYAGYKITTGNHNLFAGYESGYNNSTGASNVYLGLGAGKYIADGLTANATSSYNVLIGRDTKVNADGDQNEIVIGYDAIGLGSNSVVLGNDDITTTALKGNVGIGTTAPTEKLTVTADDTATTSVTTLLGLNHTTTGTAGAGIGSGLMFRAEADDASLVDLSQITSTFDNASSTSPNTSLHFYTRGGGNLSEVMTIDENGNIGIGTTNPDVLLQVGDIAPTQVSTSSGNSNVMISGDLEVAGSMYVGPTEFAADSGIISWVNMPVTASSSAGTVESYTAQIDGNSILTVYSEADGSGGIQNPRVGIGTTNPGYKLDVAGTAAEDGIRTEMGLDLNPVTNDEAGSVSLIATSTGNLSEGTYYYATTFYTATGETQDKQTSPSSVTTDSDHKQVQVTLPVSSDHRVIGRRIYRSKVNGVGWQIYLLADIPNNTDTTYTDNTKDSDLGSKNGYYQENTTTKYITLNGNPGMLIGTANVILGENAGATFYNGSAESKFNVLIGNNVGANITTGGYNTGVGVNSFEYLTSGVSNVAIGIWSLRELTEGNCNVAFGQSAGNYNQTGSGNTYIGYATGAGISGNSHSYNSFFGYMAGRDITTGGSNLFGGARAGYNNSSGESNVYLGYQAGEYIADGSTPNATSSYNVLIGQNTKVNADGDQNEIVIGYNATGLGSNSVVLGNDDITTTALKGNVGIGTTAPTTSLQIAGGTLAGIAVGGDYPSWMGDNGLYVAGQLYVGSNFIVNSGNTLNFGSSRTGIQGYSGTDDYKLIFKTDNVERVRIDDNGNVGIGTTTPGYILDVQDATSKVNSKNGYLTDGADYAEYFWTKDTNLKPGEVVCVDTAKKNSIKRCVRKQDINVIGIVSSKPAIIGNSNKKYENNPNYAVIGMLGQVPAKASMENGQILPGDSLTSASEPGYLMKADPGDSTVGIALEPLSQSETGIINVLISRKNKSLTVEKVEEQVTNRIAQMKIEDKVNQMVQTTIDSLNLDDQINLIVKPIQTELTAKIDETSGKIVQAENEIAKIKTDYTSLIDQISILNNQQASTTISQAEMQKQILDYENAIKIDENGNIQLNNVNISSTTQNSLTITKGAGKAIADDWAVYTQSGTNQRQLTDSDYENILEKIGNWQISQLSNEKALNLSQAPEELSADGKSISLYNYSNYLAAGLKGLLKKFETASSTIAELTVKLDKNGNVTNTQLTDQQKQTLNSLASAGLEIDDQGYLKISKISADEVKTNQLTIGNGKVAGASVGQAIIASGTKGVFVNSDLVDENSKIFVSPNKPVAIAVDEKENGQGFNVSLSTTTTETIKFDWWIIKASPVCSSEHLDLCDNETDCVGADGYWYDDACNTDPQPVCDAENLDLCISSSTCATAGGNWDASSTPPCAPKVSFNDAPYSGSTSTPITFNATASGFSTTTLEYIWYFGDNLGDDSSTTTSVGLVEHTYTATGTYPVLLEVKGDDEIASTTTKVEVK